MDFGYKESFFDEVIFLDIDFYDVILSSFLVNLKEITHIFGDMTYWKSLKNLKFFKPSMQQAA